MNAITKDSQLKSTIEWIERFKNRIHELERLKAEGKGDFDTEVSLSRNRSELAKLEQRVAEYKSMSADKI